MNNQNLDIAKSDKPIAESWPARFWNSLTGASTSINEVGERRQAQLLASITLIYSIVNLMGIIAGLMAGGLNLQSGTAVILLEIVTFIAYFLARTKYFRVGSNFFTLALAISAFFAQASSTSSNFASLYSILPTVFIISIVLVNIRFMAVLTVISTTLVAILPIVNVNVPQNLAIGSSGATFLMGILSMVLIYSRNQIENARLAEGQAINLELQTANSELENNRRMLEARVEERTQEIEKQQLRAEKRSRQFEGITRVSKAITATKNLQEALPQIARVISEQFDFYHVGIFLSDSADQYAVLSASNSQGGKKMLARGHQLKIGEQGIVGYVTQTGKPRIALNVGADANYFNNPDLPLTRSETALPLRAGDRVIGALDIQSMEANAFTNEDIEALAALADQVSLAIQNARLFDQTEKTLAEADAVQRQYLRESWSRLPKDEKLSGYRYSVAGAIPLDEQAEITANDGRKNKQEINIPIILRGETIGTLSVQVPKSEHVSTDQIDLIKAVAERVALSAENARLFEETARRAERERIISDIASKIGTSVRTESILRTTATELSQLLDGADIFINLEGKRQEAE
jgi:GAF domain-containing protein